MPIDPTQVTTGGSAALLALYVLITALVVYNSKKCAYCDVRLVVCNYLIALCSSIFALRLASATMNFWSEVPFWISYILMPGATFCLAEAGAQLVFDWHWHSISQTEIPRSQRLGWAVTRHLWLSIAFVLAMINILARSYLPIGYFAAGLFWLAALAIAIFATWIWVVRRKANPSAVGVGALLFAMAFAFALAGQSIFILFLAFGRYQPTEAEQRWPLLEVGVVTLNVLPDLLVLLPAIAFDTGDLDALRPFKFNWHKEPAPRQQPTAAENFELRHSTPQPRWSTGPAVVPAQAQDRPYHYHPGGV